MAHWSYGSGMIGCLYDNGPCFTETLRDAIEGALFIFEELPQEELEAARVALKRHHIHYFSNPQEAGAHYVEVSRHPGSCPKEDY